VDARRLAQAMETEAGLLEEFAVEHEQVLDTVRAKSWTDLERKLEALRAFEARVQAADRDRVAALPEGGATAAGFAGMAQALEPSLRVALERSYHALTLAVLRVKGSASRLDHYVGTVMGSLNAVLGELLPYRKGRLYCSRGEHRPAAEAPIVVDRKL
jgi:hypothetical protein